jgi:hypothetical protein
MKSDNMHLTRGMHDGSNQDDLTRTTNERERECVQSYRKYQSVKRSIHRDALPISKSNDIGPRPKDQRSLMKEMFEDRLLTKTFHCN